MVIILTQMPFLQNTLKHSITKPIHTMALKKQIETNTGDTGEHFELMYMHWDAHKKEFSGHFELYKNQAAKQAGKLPQKTIVAKVRAQGAKFDLYFSDEAIAKSGRTHKDQAYWVAQNDPSCLVSDYSSKENPLFAGAIVV